MGRLGGRTLGLEECWLREASLTFPCSLMKKTELSLELTGKTHNIMRRKYSHKKFTKLPEYFGLDVSAIVHEPLRSEPRKRTVASVAYGNKLLRDYQQLKFYVRG